MSNSVQPYGTVACQTPLSVNSAGKNTEEYVASVLQGSFPTKRSKLQVSCIGRQIVYH